MHRHADAMRQRGQRDDHLRIVARHPVVGDHRRLDAVLRQLAQELQRDVRDDLDVHPGVVVDLHPRDRVHVGDVPPALQLVVTVDAVDHRPELAVRAHRYADAHLRRSPPPASGASRARPRPRRAARSASRFRDRDSSGKLMSGMDSTYSTPLRRTSALSSARAGFWRRFGAAFIDGIVIGVVSEHPQRRSSATVRRRRSALLIAFALLHVLPRFDRPDAGRRCARDSRRRPARTGRSIGYARAFIRWLVSLVSGVVILLGYLWMLWDREKQTWHDKAAGLGGRSRSLGLRDVGGPVAVERRVEPARREQLVVRALLDDLAVLEDDDQVGVADRREPVGDDERGPAVQQRARSACSIFRSVPMSTELVASSRIRMRGSASSARANATSCRWPSESREPRSPSCVS